MSDEAPIGGATLFHSNTCVCEVCFPDPKERAAQMSLALGAMEAELMTARSHLSRVQELLREARGRLGEPCACGTEGCANHEAFLAAIDAELEKTP